MAPHQIGHFVLLLGLTASLVCGGSCQGPEEAGASSGPLPSPANATEDKEGLTLGKWYNFVNEVVHLGISLMSKGISGESDKSLTDGDADGLMVPTLENTSNDIIEGRKIKKKKMLMQFLMSLKLLKVGIVLPLILAVALFASWKGITISLMALMMTTVIGLKNLFSKSGDGNQHIVVQKLPSHHEHWWRKANVESYPAWEDRMADHRFSHYRNYGYD